MACQQPSTEILLVEYEVTQNAINAQNQTAWQIGAIFVVASLGVLAFVAQEVFRPSVVPSLDSVALLTILASVSWGTLYLWYLSYRRWGTFVEISHRRMHEIERTLGMWKNRDIEIVDTIIQRRDQDSEVITEEDKSHLDDLNAWAAKLDRRGRLTALSIDRAIRRIVALLLFGWLGIIVYHMPSDLLAFNKWVLLVVAFLITLSWYMYPRLRSYLKSHWK